MRQFLSLGVFKARAIYLLKTTFMILLCACSHANHPAVYRYWNSAHADARNTDYSQVGGATDITLAWQRDLGHTINLGPTTDQQGRVFVTTSGNGCHLYALDPRTGETIWCSDKVNEFAVASSPLTDTNGHVFVGDNKAMYAFGPGGDVLWSRQIDGFPLSAKFTPAGHLIFITHVGILYILDSRTGEPILKPLQLGTMDTDKAKSDPRACLKGTKECPCANTPAIDPVSGRFFFTYWEPGRPRTSLMAMRYIDYPEPSIIHLWRNDSLPGGSASSPDLSFDGDRVYVNDNNGALHAINASTGRSIWQYNVGYSTGGSQSTSPERIILPAGGSLVPLICLRDTGNQPVLLWQNDSMLNRGIPTQAVGGLVYATVANLGKGRFHNRLCVLDVTTGSPYDCEDLPGITLFTVGTSIGPEGNIYTSSFNGKVFAFKLACGSDRHVNRPKRRRQ